MFLLELFKTVDIAILKFDVFSFTFGQLGAEVLIERLNGGGVLLLELLD